MSPILVRPVREQLEHDRVIRLLQAKLKRKHEVAVNVGDEQTAGVRIGIGQMFPDLLLMSQDKAHRLEGIVEVETGESVNHLEAMAQWAHFGRGRVPFHLYVPAASVDIARRLCIENQVTVAEVWSFHTIADQTRFTLVHRTNSQRSAAPRERAEAPATPERPAAAAPRPRPRPSAPARKAARPKKAVKTQRSVKTRRK